MPELLNQYWIVLVIAAVLVVLALVVFVPRRDRRPRSIDSPQPRKPLEPRKPDIVAAPRNRFDSPSGADSAAEPSAPSPAPSIAAPPPTPPAAAAAPPQAAPATPSRDDLARMKGVGPKLVARLSDLGVTRYDQIAAWDAADIDRIDAQLGAFQGRIRRDDWVEQARLLAAGDTAGFEAKFGALG